MQLFDQSVKSLHAPQVDVFQTTQAAMAIAASVPQLEQDRCVNLVCVLWHFEQNDYFIIFLESILPCEQGNLCGNHGTCINLNYGQRIDGTSYQCRCNDGYYGDNCEHRKSFRIRRINVLFIYYISNHADENAIIFFYNNN